MVDWEVNSPLRMQVWFLEVVAQVRHGLWSDVTGIFVSVRKVT